jgi:hypothetical protein
LETPPEGRTSEIQAFQLYGLSSPAVVGVDLVLMNGLRVTAILRHGVWGMWWPSDRGDIIGCKLQVRTAAGVRPSTRPPSGFQSDNWTDRANPSDWRAWISRPTG